LTHKLTEIRFLSSNYQKFPPESNIDGKTIVFTLHRFEAANIILIQDCVLELACRIETSTGALPTADKKVAPNCNVLHTAFEAIRVYINDVCITPRFKLILLTFLQFFQFILSYSCCGVCWSPNPH